MLSNHKKQVIFVFLTNNLLDYNINCYPKAMLTARVIPKIAKNIIVRNSSSGLGNAVSSPPMNRVPFVEKVSIGLVMTASMLIVPAWVLTHLEDYKNH